MLSTNNSNPTAQTYFGAFTSFLGKIVHNPITEKVSTFVKGLINEGLWTKETSSSAPQIIYSREGSIGIIKEAAKIYYLALEGGGFRGYCYPAFIKTLDAEIPFLDDLKEVAGTSAGAIMAYMLASGASLDEINKYLTEANIIEELRGDPIANMKLSNIGLFSGNQMIQSMIDLSIKPAIEFFQTIKNDDAELSKIRNQPGFSEFMQRGEAKFKTGVTFGDLKLLNSLNSKQFKLLNVVAYDRINKKAVYFNAEDYPDTFCHVGVRSSMSIPLVFKPVLFEGQQLTDGADETNIPLSIFTSRKDYNPEEMMALILDRGGASHSILYDPLKDGYLSNLKTWIKKCRKFFSTTLTASYFKSLVQSFIDKLREWKTGKKQLRAKINNPVAVIPANDKKFHTDKPSIIRWLFSGERYLKNRNRDAKSLYELGPNVLVVPHGKGKESLNTIDITATPEKIKAAQDTAVKAALECAEWRKGMASYKSYENIDQAINALSADEVKALTASTKKQVAEYLKKYDDGKIECSDEFYTTYLPLLETVYEEYNPDINAVFAVLKFLQTVKALDRENHTPSL